MSKRRPKETRFFFFSFVPFFFLSFFSPLFEQIIIWRLKLLEENREMIYFAMMMNAALRTIDTILISLFLEIAFMSVKKKKKNNNGEFYFLEQDIRIFKIFV